jgi:hypothetical protein
MARDRCAIGCATCFPDRQDSPDLDGQRAGANRLNALVQYNF